MGIFFKVVSQNHVMEVHEVNFYIDENEYPPLPICGGKTPIWIECNLISIPPKRLGVLAWFGGEKYFIPWKRFQKNSNTCILVNS